MGMQRRISADHRVVSAAFITAWLAASLAACGAGDRAASGAAVRDSAGVTIVESAAPRWREGEGWRVVPEPAVEIGAVEGEEAYQLHRVAGALRLGDGRIVVANGGTSELRYYGPDGRHRHTAGGEGEGRTIAVVMWPLPFGRASMSAVAGERVYAGANDAFEIGGYAPGSGLIRIVRRLRPNRAATADDIERFKQDRLTAARDDDARRRIERQLAEVTFPETLPAFSGLAADAAGNLWVQEYAVGDDVNRWDVFDPDGRWLGTVGLPPGLEPYEIGEDYVLGAVDDELGVERVRLHRITTPAR